ncbi:GA12899PAlike, partial [Caligus rogercresseyi]
PEYQNYSSHHHHDETLNSLRQRLNTMRAIFGDGDESLDSATALGQKACGPPATEQLPGHHH